MFSDLFELYAGSRISHLGFFSLDVTFISRPSTCELRGYASNNGSVGSISPSIKSSLVHISDDDIPSVAADRFGGHQGGALQTLQTALLPSEGDACFLTRWEMPQ